MAQLPPPLARLEGIRRTGRDPRSGEQLRLTRSQVRELAVLEQPRPVAEVPPIGMEGHGKRMQLFVSRMSVLMNRIDGPVTQAEISDIMSGIEEDMKPVHHREGERVTTNPGISVEKHYDKLFDGGFIPKKRYVRILGMKVTLDTESDCWRFHRSADDLREAQIAEDERVPGAMRHITRRMWNDGSCGTLSRKRCDELIAEASGKFAVDATRLKEEFARIFDDIGD